MKALRAVSGIALAIASTIGAVFGRWEVVACFILIMIMVQLDEVAEILREKK